MGSGAGELLNWCGSILNRAEVDNRNVWPIAARLKSPFNTSYSRSVSKCFVSHDRGTWAGIELLQELVQELVQAVTFIST